MHTNICMYCTYNLLFRPFIKKKKIYTQYVYIYMYIRCIHIIKNKNKWQVRKRKNDVGTRTSIILGKRQKGKKIE